MTSDEAARLPIMIALSGATLTPDERRFLAERQVAGVCLFGRNVTNRHQFAELIATARELAGGDLIVAVDQEGGRVLRVLDAPVPPSTMTLGAADDVALTEEAARATERALKAMGINLNFAPVADVNTNAANPVIADRAFGESADLVARHMSAFVGGGCSLWG